MILVINTQYLENYGTADAPYWKAKGGSSYKILGAPLFVDHEEVIAISGVEYSNDFAREYVVGWSIESDDYLSQDERLQLEYDGKISFPEPTIEYADLVANV